MVIKNPGIFRTLAHWEPWYIRNTAIYGTLAYLETESYSEAWNIEDLKHIHNTAKHLR